MSQAKFQIIYENPRRPVPQPEMYEDYDLHSAVYDYMPAGAHATICINGYELDLTGLRLITLVLDGLPLVEEIATLPPDSAESLRPFLPVLPPEARIYSWMLADYMIQAPILIFAVEPEVTRIYTRTVADVPGLELTLLSGRDLELPVVVQRRGVIEEFHAFFTRYLDDLSTAFPFLHEDEKYKEYRRRIAAFAV